MAAKLPPKSIIGIEIWFFSFVFWSRLILVIKHVFDALKMRNQNVNTAIDWQNSFDADLFYSTSVSVANFDFEPAVL